MNSPSRPAALRRPLGVAALYLLLALLLWWPLPLHLTTHVPGSNTWAFDEYTFVWNLWWFRHSLLDLGVNPLHSDFIFYPLGIDLVLYTYNILNAAVALPLLDWLGPVLSSNLILIGMTVLSGWGTWLLVRWLLVRTLRVTGRAAEWAAFGAGALYAFGAYRAVYAALGHYDMVSTGFIPLFILFFLKSFWADRPRGRWRAPLLAGLFMAAALANEMIFGVFLAMLALLLLLFTWRRRGAGWRLRLALAAAVAALLWSPVGLPVVRTLLSTDFVLIGWGDALKLSADLLSFTSPTALHPLWGPDWLQELRNVKINAVSPGASRFSDVNTVFVGVLTLLLAGLGAWRFRGEVRGWAVALITFMLLSLGPVLQIGGRYLWSFDNVLGDGRESPIMLPFTLLHYIPIVQGNRAANRFSVVLMLCAAVLVGYGLWAVAQWLLARRPRGQGVAAALVGLLTVALLVEQLALPLPLTDARIPAGYALLAAEEADVAVLTLPLGWRNSFGVVGAENTRNQFYQTFHGKRLVQGNISRAPAEKFDYWQRLPLIRSLIEIENDRAVPEAWRAEDQAQGMAVMAGLGVRYLAVHPAVAGRPPYEQNRERALTYLQEMLPLELLYEGDDLLLYRLPEAELSRELSFGTPQSALATVRGWWPPESEGWQWADSEATVLLPLDDSADQRLTLEMQPYQLPQRVTLRINEQIVGAQRLDAGWQRVSVVVPAHVLRGPTARLTLQFDRVDRPVDIAPQNALIGGTGVAFPQAITVKSAGQGLDAANAQGLAWMTLDGTDVSEHRQGSNVTVIDPESGAVEAKVGFDTTANEFERDRLHDFLGSIEDGKIVLFALQGNATAWLDLDTVAALKTLGAATGPTQHNVSYALIGVKGVVEGSALEDQSESGPAYVAYAPDNRSLAAGVRWIRWEPAD